MTVELTQIVERLYHALERPTMYGNPLHAEGIALSLAAVLVSQRDGVSLDAGFRKTFAWAKEACSYIERPPNEGVYLSTETAVPEHKESFAALTKHGKIFIDLVLKSSPLTEPFIKP